MSPDAEDASPSPEPGIDLESGIMAEEKNDRASSTEEPSPTQASNSGGDKPKSNAKDPSRPRRKKARRACFACQRAHLTCGDERPCLRCIKRGLQDQCHDGVRKKAKYLHDAPAEALIPGYHSQYAVSGQHAMPQVQDVSSAGSNGMNVSQSGTYFPQTTSAPYTQYAQVIQPGQMAPPMIDTNNMMGDFNQATMSTPNRYQSTPNQQVSPQQGMAGLDQNLPPSTAAQSFDQSFIDPNDQSLFNFDVSGLNFGNHYGALEFGMLGHMSSGAVGTPDVDLFSAGGQSHQNSVAFDGFNNQNNFGYNQGFSTWQSVPNTGSRQSSTANVWAGQNPGFDAFAIGEQTSLTGASPRSQNAGYQSSTASPETPYQPFDHKQQPDLLQQSFHHNRKHFPTTDDAKDPARKRRRDTSEIYTSVQDPYPYTQGFHALTALLQKRYPSKKTLRIAKALASIRPSFISCNKNLNQADLIFMEKCFQRTLCEYEDFINSCGTPTIICRRTGEIAAASKEFSLLTGWRRDVVLGKEPNLNVNTGSDGQSGTQTGTSSRGAATPRLTNVDVDSARPQSVFLAEILDQDSVVNFYENFAELAFGASGTAMIGEPCYLLKYRTKDDAGWGNEQRGEEGRAIRNTPSASDMRTEGLMRGQAGMSALGERDGKIDCMMCWTIKRDVFDIPMLIVMNFLPNI